MGHNWQEPTLSVTHRDALMLRERIATFLLTLSVVGVALVVLLSAVQQRDAVCQDRAQQAVFIDVLDGNISRKNVVSLIKTIVLWQNATVELKEPTMQKFAHEMMIDVMDTAQATIINSGYRLLRRRTSNGQQEKWQLRTLLHNLCGHVAPISMEVFPNVDYEKVGYTIRSVEDGFGGVDFLLESSLTTTQPNRIATYSQMQQLFPGFLGLHTSSPSMLVLRSYSYTVDFVGQVYFHGVPLDIDIEVELWRASSHNTPIWRVKLSTRSIIAQDNLRRLHQSMRRAFHTQKMACTSTRCKEVADVFLA